jgi:putative oxidoreductase
MSESANPVAALMIKLYGLLVGVGNHGQSYLLGFMRWVFGIELLQAGLGKLFNIDLPANYFTQLGIPFPAENAWLVAFTETFGGLFLALGLLSRLTSIPLIINFIVAYITTEQKGLGELLNFDTGDFTGDAAFPFLAVAVVVLAFGPGALSLDYLYCLWKKREWNGPRL